MRPCRTGLKFRVKLTADEPRMIRELYDLDELSVWRESAQPKTITGEQVSIGVRDFVTVTMTLADLWLPVYVDGPRPAGQAAWIGAESHGSPHVRHMLLRFHQRDDGIVTFRSKLRGMAVVEATDVPRELDDRCLHAQT